ncbi:MAG: transporter [Burkholderiaceae bacterium]|nr:transporter [Burkholderiaceae bacterium]
MNMIDIASGLALGFAFGFVLENAGFGSPCKLTAQFRLSDWSVFKVMFTAIVFTSVGLMVAGWAGLGITANLFIPPALVGAAAMGGALVGSGFAVGGYCPGTSVVGLMSGRLDASVFLIGLLIGTLVFAGAYDQLEALTAMGEYAKGDTIPEALGVSSLWVNVVMVVAAVAVFIGGSALERKFGGPISAEQAVAGATPVSSK